MGEHEDQIKHLTINNKQLNEKLDCEMEEMRMKLGKRDLEITQIECENKVLKKMIRKYEDLVHGLRVTVSNQASEFEKLQGNQQNGAKSKSKHRSSGLHDVAQKEMKLLSRIKEKLNNLKEKAKP